MHLSHLQHAAEERIDAARPHPRNTPRHQGTPLQHLWREFPVADAGVTPQETRPRQRRQPAVAVPLIPASGQCLSMVFNWLSDILAIVPLCHTHSQKTDYLTVHQLPYACPL